MKKLFLIAFSLIALSSFAQTRTYTANNIQQGQYVTLGSDSLQVSDSRQICKVKPDRVKLGCEVSNTTKIMI